MDRLDFVRKRASGTPSQQIAEKQKFTEDQLWPEA